MALGFAFIVDGGSPAWHEALRVAVVTGALMGAASAFNDAVDAGFDRDAHVWRPIPAGLVSVQDAKRMAALLAVVALAVGATLDWRAFLLILVTLAAVYLYTAQLRPSPLAWLAWSVSFALLPLWVAESVDAFDDVLWWSFPMGLFAGLAVYMVIKLPDYERDDHDDARNVLHWMTIDYAVPLAWGAVGALIVVAVASANLEEFRPEWIIPTVSVAIVLSLTMIGVMFLGVTERRLVWQRWLLSLAIVSMTLGWLGSIAL
jgi:4-hydroxybenzoate polyprenyltransferase